MKGPLTEIYNEQNIPHELRKILNIVILAVAIGTLGFTITGGSPLTGLAQEMGAGDFVYGVLMALPVIGGMTQLYASYFMEKNGNRRKIFIISGLIQRSIWIIVAMLPWIIPDRYQDTRIWGLIFLVTMTSVAGAFVNVTFYSIFADIIPINIRGRYISIRSRFTTIAGMISGFFAAWILDSLPGFIGYSIVFFIAGIAGIIDILCFYTVPDSNPIIKSAENPFKGIKDAFKNKIYTNYLIFSCFWGFAINLAAPYFNRYALGPVKLSFTQLTIAGQITANIMSVIFISKWGRFLDRYGSKSILYFTTISTGLLSLIWVFAKEGSVWVLFVFNFIGGMIWCGTDVTTQNMILTHTPSNKRSMYIALYFVTTSAANAAAFLLGGAFLEVMGPVMEKVNYNFFGNHIDNYKLLFTIAAILRILSPLLFLGRVHNEKNITVKEAWKESFNRIFKKNIFKGFNS